MIASKNGLAKPETTLFGDYAPGGECRDRLIKGAPHAQGLWIGSQSTVRSPRSCGAHGQRLFQGLEPRLELPPAVHALSENWTANLL